MLCAATALASRADEASCESRSRALAVDGRWRVREGVATGLQLLGDRSRAALTRIVLDWVGDPHPLVQRAALAAICEPRLLKDPGAAAVALQVCDLATRRLRSLSADRRRQPDARTLRQALGYSWSVAVAAAPEDGLRLFRRLDTGDPDVAWIVRENGRKKRLATLLT
ncbi:MAG: HEAT repeat domain-containing protein [Nocardioides sp.]|uniref:HEAT repeat domain-containing protein n=1 Tax=Nocardioides sp. TaxID=35761 RepID=UPI0039E4DE78